MRLFKLILFLLVSNTILGQSYWSFKSRPAVPVYGPAVNFNDTASSSSASTNDVVTSPQRAKAQSVASSKCIDNLDFERGDFTNWKCYIGTAKTNGTNYVTWNPTSTFAPVAGRHEIISASTLPVIDPYGNFPRLCPWGGNYSLQLGSTATKKLAEKVSCSFTIPADQNNFVIEYFYAVVFQDPNHPLDQQPRFQAKVYDANNSSNIISCASYDFTAASGLPGFNKSAMDTSVLYKPWSAVTINLSGYAGHTVILEFTAEDCTLGGHFGYAYVDVNSTCTSLTNSVAYCQNTPSITLDAPSGYEEYNWYDSSYTKLLGTGQTLTLSPPPATSQVINVDLVPYSGFGCRDTAYTVLNVNPVPVVAFKSDTAVCVGKPVGFTNMSTIDDGTVMTYSWNFGDGTFSSTTNNTKTFNAVGNYKVKLVATSINGCTDSIVKTISVGALAAINPITGNKNICVSQTEILQNTTSGGIWKSLKPAIATISNVGVVSALSAGVDTIRYIVSNLYGCTDSVSFALNVIANTASTTNASICSGDAYTFNGTSYNSAGTYVKHFVNVAGCDSTATLNLAVKQPSSSTTIVSICSSEFPYVWNGVGYSSGGTYTKTFVNAVGCDSIATLKLTRRESTSSITTASVCSSNLPYVWNGTNYSASGMYTKNFINAVGCDSIAILMLMVRNSSTSTSLVSICKSDLPYAWNGISCSVGGTYTKKLINSVGCDSIATLKLTEKLSTGSVATASVCSANLPYVWNGTSYSATGTYSKHFTNAVGCDSTATLNLTVKLPSSSSTTASICTADLPYVWNGTNYTVTGTYSTHLTNAVGCDSTATLDLIVKFPSSSSTTASVCTADLPYVWNGTNYTITGTYSKHFMNAVGCDSTATLNLTVKLPSSSISTASVCSADLPYVWNGMNYTVTGTYSKHFMNAVGCDSTATLNLTVKLPSSSISTASVCSANLPYVWNGTSYSATGTYSKHFTNAVGCDSTATLNITVKLPSSSSTTASICTADLPYVWNGTNYTVTGTYSTHLTNAVGCDSTATLDLIVKFPSSSSTTASVCTADLPYVWNGTNYTITGTYSKHFMNSVGCDSTATLNLTVKLPSSSSTTASVCTADLPFVWNGTNYTVTGTYNKHFTNAVGCDSTATLNLTVKLPSSSSTTASVCTADLPFVWNGTNYTVTGTYNKHFTNAVGCDSTATLDLIVKFPSSSSTTASVCTADLPYVWNGTNYTITGTYSKHFMNAVGCDSTATLNLTVKLPSSSISTASVCSADLPYVWNGMNYTVTGTYSKHFMNAVGCDSTATLNLTVKLPSSSISTASVCSANLPYVWNGTSYSATGTYSKHFTNAVGCDSTATLNITVKLPSSSSTTASICTADLPYVWNGTNYTVTGTYSTHLTNAVGCDSTATLDLIVKFPSSSSTTASVCTADLPYVWNGTNYTITGTYSKHFMNSVGCDSTATLNLTVKLPSSSSTTASVCTADLPFVWNGTNYTVTGTYNKHFTNAVGCDSTATLNLTVKLPSSSSTTASVCTADLPFVWNGTNYTVTGTYNKHFTNAVGCDSTVTLNLTVKLPSSSSTTASVCTADLPFVWNGTNYTVTGTYNKHFTNAVGCDSTVTLNLTVKLPSSSSTTASVCSADLPYVWNGANYTATGTYSTHFMNSVGCDSTATLNLTVKLPSSSNTTASVCSADLPYVWNGTNYSVTGTYNKHFTNAVGCDSTATLDLTVKFPSSSNTTASVCSADLPYVWNGTNYTATGTYSTHFMNSVGCDSTATLNLTVKLPSSSSTTASVCSADLPYVWNGTNYTATGTYNTHFMNSVGCDSTATLNLTVKLPSSSNTTAFVCSADLPYVWNGTNYTATGTYSTHFMNSVGCDSTATLNLTVKLPSSSSTTASVCTADLPFVWNGTNYTVTGTYNKHFTNAVGCDSTVTLNLTVKLPSSSSTTASVCTADLPFVWNGTNYTVTGTYNKHFTNAVGCDSTVTLNLAVKLPSSSSTTASVCSADLPYVWNGTNYTATGTYNTHFMNSVGCDSTATLNLTVKLPSSSNTTAFVCSADLPYVWNGTNYTATGTYSTHFMNSVGCDSTATLNLTVKLPSSSSTTASVCTADLPFVWNGTNYTVTGTYNKHFTNAVGCDSTVTLNLTVKLPSSSSTTASVCTADLPFVWNGTNYTVTGTYNKHFTNAVGCDSTVTLNLAVKLPSSSSTTASVCSADLPYVWNGTNYTATGTYNTHFMNSVGCDSTATLNLTVKLPSSSNTTAFVCSADLPYVWNGTNYTATGTYNTHFMNSVGCDSTATLNLTVKLPSSSNTTAFVCSADLPYVWNGTNYTATGTYNTHFMNSVGCDSTATLNLTVKLPSSSNTTAFVCSADLPYVWNGTNYTATGTYSTHFMNSVGCDSTATLNLTVKLPSSSNTTAFVCSADLPYVWNGTNYTATGTYSTHFMNSVGCDSTATLNLTVKLPSSSSTTASVCSADLPYVWNGINYSVTGTYNKHFTNAVGCDSTATLDLTVKLPSSSINTASVCTADLPFVWNGTNYTVTGTYNKHFTNAVGCDSTATLDLTVKLPSSSTYTASVCSVDLPYVWNGTNYTVTGIYSTHFTNAVGCDSTATLDLTVKLPSSSTYTASVCSVDLPYVWNGMNYTATGTYNKHFMNAVGCDSTATLNLTVKLPSSSSTTASVCYADLPYVWNGMNYTVTGIYSTHFMNSVGCDSTATLNLTVKLPTSSVTNSSICQGDSYLFNGTSYTTSGTYIAHLTNKVGCDSVATLKLIVNKTASSVTEMTTCPSALPFVWNGISYPVAGKYSIRFTSANGCDSIANLVLYVKTPLTSTTTEYVCSSLLPYVWNKKLYYNSGTYTAQFISASGCDSVATLELTVVSPSSSISIGSVSSLELPYVWNKLALTESGTYTAPDKYLNSMGCDSIAKLILKVNLSTSAVTNASVCVSDLPYTWNATPYYNAGTFTKTMTNVLGQDVTVTLNLSVTYPQTTTQKVQIFSGESYTINGHVYDKAGVYTDNLKTVNGCDSTVVIELSFINVPNTITPNGDGYNDSFMKGWRVQIYNRNGILLYDGDSGWDGNYNKKPVSKDTYFYVLFYPTESGLKTKEGYLMVIR